MEKLREELSRALPLFGGDEKEEEESESTLQSEEIDRLGVIVAEIFSRDPLLQILRKRQAELDSMDIEA